MPSHKIYVIQMNHMIVKTLIAIISGFIRFTVYILLPENAILSIMHQMFQEKALDETKKSSIYGIKYIIKLFFTLSSSILDFFAHKENLSLTSPVCF